LTSKYYKAIVIKIAWWRHKRRYVDQWYRIESLEVNLYIYSQMIFDKGAKNAYWRKVSLLNKWCWKIGYSHAKESKVDPILSMITSINSKCIKSINVRP
jgi:hypothetical protein